MQPKVKLLVIEDEQNIRQNVQELLEAKGYQVRTAANGKEGVSEALDFKPHLILCDIMMPKMDGYKVLETVRKTTSIQNVPFIFLTAKVDKQDIRQGMEMGADDYLTKPFTSKELTGSIEARLQRQEKLNAQYTKVKHELDTAVFSTYFHEFNTPLHGIVGGLNLLINSGKSFGEKQKHDLQVSIRKSAIRLNHSLSNLMLYEEIKRAEDRPELIELFASGQSGDSWPLKIKDELFTIAKEIYGRVDDLVVEFHNPAELGISYENLHRLLNELTDNAFKFSKHETKVFVKGSREKENYIFEITDEGTGFILNSIDDIGAFKQFNRKKFEQQGLGIGLHLVKQLIRFNRGDLEIISEENIGTKIIVRLPLFETV